MKRETPAEEAKRRDAAYERGWVHSLRAFDACALQPTEDIYDYVKGWNACSEYRWQDPANRGRAPDPSYRKPRI